MDFDHRIEKREGFTVVGIEITIPHAETGTAIPATVKKVFSQLKEIKNLVTEKENWGISFGLKDGILTYMFGFEVSKVEDVPEGMVSREIPANEYVIFDHKGHVSGIKNTFNYIYSKWIPENGYEAASGPCLELYGERFFPDCHPRAEESITELYVPIQKKGSPSFSKTFSRIEKKEAFIVVGIEIVIPMTETAKAIPEAVKKTFAQIKEIKNLTKEENNYGISLALKDGIITYLFGFEVSKAEDVPEEMVSREIPVNEYVVFDHKGQVEGIKETFSYIYSKWIPENGYEAVNAPCFERYGERFFPVCHPKASESITEIYVPIHKKN